MGLIQGPSEKASLGQEGLRKPSGLLEAPRASLEARGLLQGPQREGAERGEVLFDPFVACQAPLSIGILQAKILE